MQTKEFSVFICDDQSILMDSLASSLPRRGIEATTYKGKVFNAHDIVEQFAASGADVLLIDIRLSQTVDGVSVSAEILKTIPDARIVIMSQYENIHLIKSAYDAGALGYFNKASRQDVLVEALTSAFNRVRFVDPTVTNALIFGSEGLNEKERQVYLLLAKGCPKMEIAEKLGIAPRTLAALTASVLKKLALDNTGQLGEYAAKMGDI